MKNVIKTIKVSAILGVVAIVIGFIVDLNGLVELLERKLALSQTLRYPLPIWSFLLLLTLALISIPLAWRYEKIRLKGMSAYIKSRSIL